MDIAQPTSPAEDRSESETGPALRGGTAPARRGGTSESAPALRGSSASESAPPPREGAASASGRDGASSEPAPAQRSSYTNVSFRRLDAQRIVETADSLSRRIAERFPGSGLLDLSREVQNVAGEALKLAEWLARPHWIARGSSTVLSVGLLSVAATAALQVRIGLGLHSFAEWAQAIESMVNDLVFVGIAMYFVWSLETRRKRAKAIAALHVLRSLAHIVDMHQLTKDPDRTVSARADTASSPRGEMSAFTLTRYLDYCSELLAILSKIAALYVQELSDPTTVAAANAVEELCVGLSRTIWQKIMILDRVLSPNARAGAF